MHFSQYSTQPNYCLNSRYTVLFSIGAGAWLRAGQVAPRDRVRWLQLSGKRVLSVRTAFFVLYRKSPRNMCYGWCMHSLLSVSRFSVHYWHLHVCFLNRFMAIASNFVLNGLTESGAYRVYPWISKYELTLYIQHCALRIVPCKTKIFLWGNGWWLGGTIPNNVTYLTIPISPFPIIFSVCNVAKVQDSLQHFDIPDRAAVDMLNAFSPPPVNNNTNSEQDRYCWSLCILLHNPQHTAHNEYYYYLSHSVQRAQTVDGNHSSRIWRRHYSKNRPLNSNGEEGTS